MRILALCLLMSGFVSCRQPVKTASLPKAMFDSIENLTGTANWELIDGVDTSYIYFSRMGDTRFDVYHYRIDKGDSVNTRRCDIIYRQDSVIWSRENGPLLLAAATDSAIVWKGLQPPKEQYKLEKQDSSHLLFLSPGAHTSAMKRTLPLAMFLVRKRYDFLHATSYVDSAEVAPRKTTRVVR